LGIAESVLIPLSKADKDRARELLTRPYMVDNPAWKEQVGSRNNIREATLYVWYYDRKSKLPFDMTTIGERMKSLV